MERYSDIADSMRSSSACSEVGITGEGGGREGSASSLSVTEVDDKLALDRRRSGFRFETRRPTLLENRLRIVAQRLESVIESIEVGSERDRKGCIAHW